MLDKPRRSLPVELQVPEPLPGRPDPQVPRPVPVHRRARPALHAEHRHARGAARAAAGGPLELHAAEAAPALAQHVRELLGDAAPGEHGGGARRAACSALAPRRRGARRAAGSDPDVPVGWASVLVPVVLFSGVQLVMLGLLGEYLGRLFLTENQTPQFVVREVVEAGAPGAGPGVVGAATPMTAALGLLPGPAGADHRRPRIPRQQPRDPAGRPRGPGDPARRDGRRPWGQPVQRGADPGPGRGQLQRHPGRGEPQVPRDAARTTSSIWPGRTTTC